MHEPIPTTVDEHGRETHPAWGMIAVHRVSSSPGAVLFDSDIKHQHSITLTVSTAKRDRDLNRDWIHPDKEFLEVQMSEAQWASVVSSMNTTGVPVTIRRREREFVPGVFYEPRLQESVNEVRRAADGAVEKIRDAFEAVEEAFESNAGKKELRQAIRNLHFAIEHTPANMEFAAKSLNEHTENVVQKARADLEAMVLSKAEQLKLDPADLADVQLLGDGS